ncbi:hypothetical protein E2C01_064409 [Portunus trituberculatus]|uniref:Uncharacterized protein n=1 Tax=Portunus trituberculatus TaxID=210409 RepID=A0A5B7HK92_PORTR|nr:hypothetical protein [Portunus trituberculatus]
MHCSIDDRSSKLYQRTPRQSALLHGFCVAVLRHGQESHARPVIRYWCACAEPRDEQREAVQQMTEVTLRRSGVCLAC